MARIRIKNGPQKDRAVDVGDTPLVIGREPSCAIQILDKGASRQHAEVFRIGEMCFLRDLESRNGTFLNDARVDEEMLREGDRIQIGATVIVYEDSARDTDFEFTDDEEDDSSSTLELKLEDLTDLTAAHGDGDEVHRLRALYRLGRMIGEADSEKKLIDKVLPFIAQELEADLAYLFTRNPDTGAISPIGSYLSKGHQAGKISRTIIRRAIVDKRAILTSDAMSDGRFKAQESIVLKGIRSVLCVPLSVSGNLSGVMYLSSDSPSVVFRDDELELAAAMADQVGLAIANFRILASQREVLMNTISALVRAVEMHDPTMRGRSERISRYAAVVAKKLGLEMELQQNISLAGLLHNIGVLAEGPLAKFMQSSKEKFETTKSTPEQMRVNVTLEIISGMACYQQIEKTIRYMYERIDGSGPEKLKGEKIPATAKILGLVMDFDNLCIGDSGEPDKSRTRDAVAEIGRQAGRKYDESAVKALLLAHRDGSLYQGEAASAAGALAGGAGEEGGAGA